MTDWKDILRFKDRDSILTANFGHFGDTLIDLMEFLENKKPAKVINGIVGICPSRPPRQRPEWIRLYTLTTTGTDYGAIRGAEEALARYYMKSGVLALVEPIRLAGNIELKQSHPLQARYMARQGAFVYADHQ